MATKTETFRVRAVDSAHIFYGDEHPALGGIGMRLMPGQDPVEIPTPLALYFNEFPGLRVDTANPVTTPLETEK